MSKQQAHLEFIQGVINRLSNNSFLLKGWTVILVSGLFALSAHQSNPTLVLVAYFPALLFWFLDGYFLWQERRFRCLFDDVRGKREEEINYSMDTNTVSDKSGSWVDAVFSRTLLFFHGVLIATIVIVMIVLWLTM